MDLKKIRRGFMVLLSTFMIISNQPLSVVAATYSDSNLEDEVKVDHVEIKRNEEVNFLELLKEFELPENNVEKELEVIETINNEEVNLGVIKVNGTFYHIVLDESVWNTLDDKVLAFNQEGSYLIYEGDGNYTVNLNEETKNQFNSLSLSLTGEKAKLSLAEIAQSNAQSNYDEVVADLENADTSYLEAKDELATKKENLDKAQSAYDDAVAALEEAQSKYDSASGWQQTLLKAALEAAQKALDAAKTALDNAQAEYEAQEEILADADTYKANLEDQLVEKENALEEAKANTQSAQVSVNAAQNALDEYIESVKNDLENNVTVTVEYATTDNLKNTFSLNIYDELSVEVTGLDDNTLAKPEVNNANGQSNDGYKVYLSNADTTVTVPMVDGYKIISVKLNDQELIGNNYVYQIGQLQQDSTVKITYAESSLSDIQIVDVENAIINVVNDEGNPIHDNDIVVEGTTLTISVTVDEGYELEKIYVKKFNEETGLFDNEVTLDDNDSFVVGEQATTYEISATVKYIASKIEVLDNENVSSVELSNDGLIANNTLVTITPNAELGYEIEDVKVMTTLGQEVEVTNNNDGTYSFTTVGGYDYSIEVITKDISSSFNPGNVDFNAVDVQVSVSGSTFTLTQNASITGIIEGEEIKVTLTPKEGTYISDYLITDVNGKVTTTVNQLGKGVFELVFNANKETEYFVTVETNSPVLESNGEIPVINKYDIIENKFDNIKEEIIKQGYIKADGISLDEISIKYRASDVEILGGYLWLDLNVDAVQTAVDLVNEKWPSVLPGKDKVLETIYNSVHDFGAISEEIIKVEFNGNTYYPAISEIIGTVSIEDLRNETFLDVNTEVSVVYGEFTNQDILHLILDRKLGVYNSDGMHLDELTRQLQLSDNYENYNAGTYTIIVSLPDEISNEYKGCSAKVTLTIEKASSTTHVTSLVTDYGVNIDNLISTDPSGVKYISFLLGLDMNEKDSVIHVNIPEIIDIDQLPTWAQDIVRPILDEYSNWEGSVSELAPYLEDLVDKLNSVNGSGYVNLDTAVIEKLIDILYQIAELDGVGDLTVKLTLDQDITPTNAGAYLVGAITSDMNYETSYDLGYLVIKPLATEVELEFNVVDENGIITTKAIQNGYDLGSHVVGCEEASQYLKNIYFGITLDGETYIENEPTAMPGAYSQIAYIHDLGNEMYYALPIVRAYVVVSDVVNVDFKDGDQKVVVFNNLSQSMEAIVTDKNGNECTKGTLSYRYVGMQSNGMLYHDVVGPTHAGVYSVIATYIEYDEDNIMNNVGMGIAQLVILPTSSTITVDNLYHVYDGKDVDLSELIDASSSVEGLDVDKTIITFEVEASNDVSENGLNGIGNVVNVDLPTWLDELLQSTSLFEEAYGDGYLIVEDLVNILEFISTNLGEDVSVEGINAVVDQLKQLPMDVKLTLHETKDLSIHNIGIYTVIGIVTDSDHLPAVDVGVVVIAPSITEATLEWNYQDLNGIITLPALNKIDFNATAILSDSTISNEITSEVQYLFIGIDDDGNLVMTTDAKDLTLGAYTEVAYVLSDVGADMYIVDPIIRSFIVTPQTVTITFVDENGNENNDRIFVYDGNPHEMPVIVEDMDGNIIDDERLENLTVVYYGITSKGEVYASTMAPINVGTYTVVATYYETDENGEVLNVGMATGIMAIEGANVDFTIDDMTIIFDGEGHLPVINNPYGLTFVTIIVDENGNLNIIFPESWDIPTKSITSEELIKLIDEYIGEIEISYEIANILSEYSIQSITINGEYPSAVGTYKVYAFGFGDNYAVQMTSGTLIIELNEEPIDPEDPEDPENPVEPEDPEDPEDPVEPENPEDPVEPSDPTDPEVPSVPEKGDAPTTSDNSYVTFYIWMVIMASFGLIILSKKRNLNK